MLDWVRWGSGIGWCIKVAVTAGSPGVEDIISHAWPVQAREDKAFAASKQEIIRQCQAGVRSFNPHLHTALATDWSKQAMGFWLCQKYCKCEGVKPGCCRGGWQTTYCGSKFCSPAEGNMAPIEGEAASASHAWPVQARDSSRVHVCHTAMGTM